MAFIWNITFNCADPQALAAFWAAVTGYVSDPQTDGDPDRVRLVAPDGRGVRHLLFHRADEPQVLSNAIHLDLASKDVAADLAAIVAAGATLVDGGTAAAPVRRGEADHGWVVLRDPAGNEFCVG